MGGVAVPSNQFIGGYYSGFTFPEGSYIEGATIQAPSQIGKGSILKNVTFVCARNFFGRCTGLQSRLGVGVIMEGGTAAYVVADVTNIWSGVSIGSLAQPPDCVDCPPRGESQGNAAGTWTGQVIVNRTGGTTEEQICQAQTGCDSNGTLIQGGGVTVS